MWLPPITSVIKCYKKVKKKWFNINYDCSSSLLEVYALYKICGYRLIFVSSHWVRWLSSCRLALVWREYKIYPSLVAFHILLWFKNERKYRNTSAFAFSCSFTACSYKGAIILGACVRVCTPLPSVTSESISQRQLVSPGSSSTQDIKLQYALCASVPRRGSWKTGWCAHPAFNGREPKGWNASLTLCSWNR